MKKSTDNLNELLRRFVEDSAADSMAEEIRRGDAMLDLYPAPALGSDAAARIRSRLKAAQTYHRHRAILGWSTVAAAAVIGVAVFWTGLNRSVPSESKPIAQLQLRSVPQFRPSLWDETLSSESDQTFAAINTELDNIAETIEAVRFKEISNSQDCFSDDRDAERMENKTNTTDFWQG
jgi:hypothetical protein